MRILTVILALFVAAQHVGFLVLEMFLWQDEAGMGVFGTTPEQAANTAVLAANQGLYNGFLAAGLIWATLRGNREFTRFFLLCVIAAGVYGALTASMTILYVQAAPAALALVFSLAGSSRKST
jgi:putative membrane protein